MNTPASPAGDAVAIALDAWRRGATEDALDRLHDAALAGDGAALETLLQLPGQTDAPEGIERRVIDAVRAVPAGPARNRHLAFLTAAGRGCEADPAAALALRLDDADKDDAGKGDAGAMTELGLLALMADQDALARTWLERAAQAGSGHAIAALLRLGAQDGAVSPLARRHAPALARAGHPLGGALMQAIAGLPDAEADAAATPGGAMPALPDGFLEALGERDTPSGETLSDDPRVTRHDGALPAAVCDYLAAGGAPFLQPATVFDPATGVSRPDPYRTSLTAALPDGAMDLVLWAIKRRMAGLAGADFAQGEPLSLLVYRPGEEYRAHFDFMTEDGGTASADLARRGQRIATSLIKLNDEHEGGATRFPRLDLSWTGRRGDALSFANVDGTGRGDKRTLHAGEPVSAGMKILASLWLRERA